MTDARPPALTEDVFRRLLESMNKGVVLAADDGVILYTNPALDRMFRYEPGELIGEPIRRLSGMPSESSGRPRGWVGFTEAMNEQGGWRGQWRQRRKDGTEFVSSVQISPLYLDGVRHWFAVQDDVTEAQLAEDALRASEQRLELAAATGEIGIWDWDLLTGEVTVSQKVRAIFGLAPDAPVSIDVLRAAQHPQDHERVLAQSARAIDPAIRERQIYEYRIVRPDGATRWIAGSGEAVFARGPGGGERAVRFAGTVQDITERKAVEENLRESEARLRLAVDVAQIGVWSIDPATRTLRTTPELNRILGFADEAKPTLEEVRARYLPGELDKVRAAAQDAVDRGERHFEAEFRALGPGEAVRWLVMRADVTPTPKGRARASIGVLFDVTERKEAEERVALLAREVNHRANNLLTVIQATIALTQAPDVETMKAVLSGRVAALAHAHQLLADARWEGADLRRLAEEELGPYRLGDASRATIDGGSVELHPHAAQSLAIALHELATNAAKHGALSVEGGAVAVRWSGGASERLVIRWSEHNGPPVSPPTREGLGLQVVERALGGSIGGEVRFDWRAEGLVCEMTVPPPASRPSA
ncbi:PAS domain S-box protein [Phenylobacterium sp.]|uniref:sensor histidine kinase n=1 Tax=Phenylobacterium sp. TaxID=1871053 RepID=UPI0035B03508